MFKSNSDVGFFILKLLILRGFDTQKLSKLKTKNKQQMFKKALIVALTLIGTQAVSIELENSRDGCPASFSD